MSITVDLSEYAGQILADEDRPLFQDAVASAEAGALRAAYVMIWLACAESLKRRFREAQKRDGAAGRTVGDIEAREKDHKAVDKLVLDKAKEYGFLSEPGHTVLNHVYEMRCIYGHPYEEEPSAEQVSHAAAMVVEHVLSLPVKLRHGFGETLLESLLTDRSYLDDQRSAVQAFAKDILPRLDEAVYVWFLDKYWESLEPLADDASLAVFRRRGMWFSGAMLKEAGVDLISKEGWHDRLSRFPKMLVRICSGPEIYANIGRRAQDSVVGAILDESATRASVLKNLARLDEAGVLTERQSERFRKRITAMKSSALRAAGLSTKTCFDKVISALESHDWYVQNPAMDLVISNGPEQAKELSKSQQIVLGRNILQAAEGNARSAVRFMDRLAESGDSWPHGLVLGIAVEAFTNESNEIRFKDEHLDEVLAALEDLKPSQRKPVLDKVIESLGVGKPKAWVDKDDFDKIRKALKPYTWAKPLAACMKSRGDELFPGEAD